MNSSAYKAKLNSDLKIFSDTLTIDYKTLVKQEE